MIRSARTRLSIPLFAIPAVAMVAFAGCSESQPGFSALTAATKKVTVNQPYTGTSTALPGGTQTQIDNQTVQVSDQPFTGTLAASLPKKIEIQSGSDPDKTFKVKRLTGSYYTSVDGTTRANGSGQWTGTQVIRFDRRKLGFACVGFESTTSNNNTDTGTFRVLGGTKAMKRIRFSGTFTQQAQSGSINGQITGTINLQKKKRSLTDECRALKPLVP